MPILGGVRLTGKAGRYSVGALNIQTEDAPETAAGTGRAAGPAAVPSGDGRPPAVT